MRRFTTVVLTFVMLLAPTLYASAPAAKIAKLTPDAQSLSSTPEMSQAEYLQAFAKWAKEKQAIQNLPQIQQASCVWEFVTVWGFTIAFELNFHAAGCGLGGGGGSAF